MGLNEHFCRAGTGRHLYGGPGWQAQHPDTVEVADGYSQLTVNVRKINPLVNAVSPGLQIADGSRLLMPDGETTG